jgi:hypothetical protein
MNYGYIFLTQVHGKLCKDDPTLKRLQNRCVVCAFPHAHHGCVCCSHRFIMAKELQNSVRHILTHPQGLDRSDLLHVSNPVDHVLLSGCMFCTNVK